eukprot:9980951-Lingulodinium_polyedra.AAC.1
MLEADIAAAAEELHAAIKDRFDAADKLQGAWGSAQAGADTAPEIIRIDLLMDPEAHANLHYDFGANLNFD